MFLMVRLQRSSIYLIANIYIFKWISFLIAQSIKNGWQILSTLLIFPFLQCFTNMALKMDRRHLYNSFEYEGLHVFSTNLDIFHPVTLEIADAYINFLSALIDTYKCFFLLQLKRRVTISVHNKGIHELL